MPDIFKEFCKARRKGVTIAEAVILIIVVVVTLGAVFSTMTWAVRSYAAGKAEKESRAVYFAWAQAFESMWPTKTLKDRDFIAPGGFVPEDWKQEAEACFAEVSERLWGTSSGETGNGFTVAAEVSGQPDKDKGTMELHITVSNSEKTYVNLRQLYNIYTDGRVSDDVFSN